MTEIIPDQTDIAWKDPVFVGQVQLANRHVAMDYFQMSPFYERSCNNEVLRMQYRFNQMVENPVQMEQDLANLTGTEFRVTVERPPRLFVVTRLRRYGPQLTEPLAVYYILDGTIYQAPSLLSILQRRVMTSLWYLQGALGDCADEICWNSNDGYLWRKDAEFYDKRTIERMQQLEPADDATATALAAAAAEDEHPPLPPVELQRHIARVDQLLARALGSR